MASATGSSRAKTVRVSLRAKVALCFFALTIVLLIARALGVQALAEAQEERLITALIRDALASVVRSYRSDPALLPPFCGTRVSLRLKTAAPAGSGSATPVHF